MHIPDELEFVAEAQEVDVEKVGNTLVLRMVPTKTLAGISDIFASFSLSFMAEGREFEAERERL
jgi:antitoxin VapB